MPCEPRNVYRACCTTRQRQDRPFESVPSREILADHGAQVIDSFDQRTLLDDYYYLSGEIPRVTSFENGRICAEKGKIGHGDPILY